MTQSTSTSERPLSPHVSIYRWPITMAMSIAHRVSGGALYFGTVFLAIWLAGVACGEETFNKINFIYSSFIGRTILLLYTLALVHHMVGGVRHLFWDVKTSLLEKQCATRTAWATVGISIVLTLAVWIAAYVLR